jgi:hypothetical protein
MKLECRSLRLWQHQGVTLPALGISAACDCFANVPMQTEEVGCARGMAIVYISGNLRVRLYEKTSKSSDQFGNSAQTCGDNPKLGVVRPEKHENPEILHLKNVGWKSITGSDTEPLRTVP